MTFSSYLTNLIIPFNLCMTLVVIGLVLGLFRLRKTGGALIVAGLLWALAWSLPVTSVWLGGALESRYPHLSPEQSPTADAIVVLGGNTANGRANWFLPYEKDKAVVRIDIAAQLYLAGRAPKVLLSGGALEGDVSEARGMAHAIRQQGVPETALILENSSRTTYENAAMTEDQLKARGIGKILLVTSALHMPRAMAAFAKQGVVAIAAPAPPQIVPPTDGSLSLWCPTSARSTPAAPSSRNTRACSSTGCAAGCGPPRSACGAQGRRCGPAEPAPRGPGRGGCWRGPGLLAWINKIYECAFAGAGLPAWLWGLLYCAVDFQSDPWHAGWQAGRRALCAVAGG